MPKVKVDTGLIETTSGKITSSKSEANSIIALLEALSTSAINQIQDRLTAYSPTKEDENGKQVPDTDKKDAAERTANEKKLAVSTKKGEAITAINNINKKLGSVSTGLENIINAVNTFNESVDMQKAFDQLNITISYEENGENVNGGTTPIVYYVIDGQKYTISELLNAFYTYTGMSMSTVVSGAILAEELGIDYSGEKGDIIRNAMLGQVGALTGFAAESRLFGLATEADQNNFAKAVGLDPDHYGDATSLLTEKSATEKNKDFLNKLPNAFTTKFGASVAGGLMGAYGLASFLNKYPDPNKTEAMEEAMEKADTPTVPTWPSGSEAPKPSPTWGYEPTGSSGGSPVRSPGSSSGGSPGGSSGGSSKKPKTPKDPSTKDPKDPTATPTDPNTPTKPTTPTETPVETPGLVSPTECNTEPLVTPEDASQLPPDVLPSIPDGIEKNYDDLARQQFESQGEEAIAEHRAEIIEKANQLFEAEDKGPLKEQLRKYGYSDSDIEIIIQDRDLTVNALVSGDQREQLAKIAQDLAKQDGVTEFDTIYDNEQTATSLTDGTTTKLLANMSSDEGVKTAYTAFTTAETAYTEANTAAATAMATMTAAQAKLTEITNKIGGDIKSNPYQWDANTMKDYNAEVSKLHDETVRTIGGNINNWSDQDIKTYQEAETRITNEVAYRRGTDVTTWTAAQRSEYEGNLKNLEARYVTAYGEKQSEWSADVIKKYTTAKNNTYKQMAVEVGKSKLTDADRKTIAKKVQATKDEIIAKNGNYNNWTEDQKKAYDEKLEEIKKKYSDKTSTATGEAVWTKEQAQEYNAAVAEYNEAVKAAKEAMANLETAKTGYNEAKTNLDAAKETFFNNLMTGSQPTNEETAPPIIDANETQTNSGKPTIGGIEFNESGASIGASGTTVLDENGVVQPQQPAAPTSETINTAQPEIIVDDDKAETGTQDYGIPIVDIGSNTSGTISNDDIRI